MAYEGYEFSRKFTLKELMEAPNVGALMSEDDREYVGRIAQEGYQEDLNSRRQWEERSATAMKLTLQVMESKTFPWSDCSNVKFPLVTVAAMQYAARAYPALIDSTDLVNCRIYGPDPDGQKTARGDRIAAHMTWQNIRQDKGWEESHDKALLVQSIMGCAFIKKIYDPVCRHSTTKLVMPDNFVVNYHTRHLDSSQRYTETFDLSDNQIRQAELAGHYCKYGEEDAAEDADDAPQVPKTDAVEADSQLAVAQDMRTGLKRPPLGSTTPYKTGEQYCWWDFDDDGFKEPYIVTFDIGTGFVRRIVARFLPNGVSTIGGKKFSEFARQDRLGNLVVDANGKHIYDLPPGFAVYDICPVRVYTKIPFIPSPDGGFYDLGLGQLLGPINESVNTNINQINDAGTMATLGGGFVGRGFKNRGGPFTMRPFEWYPIDAPGDDLHKNILPLPVREPSNVLLQLAQYLIAYGERIASANDIQMGESPGQNTPAETTRTLNENGARVYSAIYKRTWRAFGEELCIQYDLNQLHFEQDEDFIDLTSGKGAMVRADDYKGPALEVVPSADPYVVSESQKIQQAQMLVQAANQLQGFNRYQTTLRWLKAQKVQDVEAIYPPPMQQGPNGQMVPAQDFPPPPPDAKMVTAQAAMQKVQLQAQAQQQSMMEAHINLINEIQESRAKVQNLYAQAQLYEAQAKSEVSEPIIKLIYAEIESEGNRSERMLRAADTLLNHVRESRANADDGGTAGRSDGTAMGDVEKQSTNAALLAAPNGSGGGLQGLMGAGQAPLQ